MLKFEFTLVLDFRISHPNPAKWNTVLNREGVIIEDKGIQLKYWAKHFKAKQHRFWDSTSKGGNASSGIRQLGDLNMLLSTFPAVSLDSRGELNSITDEDLRRVDPSSPEVGDGGGVAATKWRCFSRTDSKISTNIQNNFNTHVITEKLVQSSNWWFCNFLLFKKMWPDWKILHLQGPVLHVYSL